MGVVKTFSEQRNFFLTGLPRTRTAWFSEYLDCFHEGIEGCSTYSEYVNKLGDSGDSSSLLMYFPLREYFPDSPLVIVERDIDDVCDSLENIGLFDDRVYWVLKQAQGLLNKMDGVRVDYNSLDIKGIWEYLTGMEFDKKRADEYEMRNIQKVNRHPDRKAWNQFISVGGF